MSVAAPYLGHASELFGFVPLSAMELAAVAWIVGGYIPATEIAKVWFFGQKADGPSRPTGHAGGHR